MIDELVGFKGESISEVEVKEKSLTLTFIKKTLFIKKRVSFEIKSREDISMLSKRNLKGAVLNDVKLLSNSKKIELDFLINNMSSSSTFLLEGVSKK